MNILEHFRKREPHVQKQEYEKDHCIFKTMYLELLPVYHYKNTSVNSSKSQLQRMLLYL